MSGRWPETLWIIRHGQSRANLDSAKAEADGDLLVPLHTRDMDTPLSPAGHDQATELGRYFARLTKDERPTVIIASPYLRTRQTLEDVCNQWDESDIPRIIFDERLRERERGVFDGLTRRGVAERIPEESEKRRFLGKFYHRAPGGESWCDVVQRLRAVVDRVLIRHEGERVMIIAHEVVIYCMRYIIENMDEAQILAIDAEQDIGNCAVTEYRCDAARDKLVLRRFNVSVC
jgi:2,3-bisphosphoglycerate-dependent phosphoglycerate mutase